MNRNSRKFDIELSIDDVPVRVTGSVAPFYPATREDPPEGGELEDVRFFKLDGEEIPDPKDEMFNALESSIYERLEAEDAGPDPDAENDAMRDFDRGVY